MKPLLANFLFAALLGVSACASLEPEPCTTDWVEWQTAQITSDFRRTYGPELRDLAAFSRQMEDPSPLVLLQMTSRLSDFQTMAESFAETVMPPLQSAVDQCGTPTRFVSAFGGLLEQQGVDGTVLGWVEEAAELMEDRFPDAHISGQGAG